MSLMLPQACELTDATHCGACGKLSELGCTKTSMQGSSAFCTFGEDEEETDVGSGGSDAESTCSSASASEHSEGLKQSIRQKIHKGNTSLPRQRPRVPPRGRFGGTPLSPIPGTPVAFVHDARPSFALPAFGFASTSDDARGPSVQSAMPSGRAPQARPTRPDPTVLAYDSHGTPLVHTRPPVTRERAREVVVEKSKREAVGLPQKIAFAAHIGQPTKYLDPTVPAKKRPPFRECTSVASAAFRSMHGLEPIKKRVTGFLLADPPSVTFTSHARNVCAAR